MHLNELLSTWWNAWGRTLVVTILATYVASSVATLGLLFSWESVPAALLVATFVIPAPILYLWIGSRGNAIAKHVVYHLYWLAGVAYCVVVYFTAVELPELASVLALFIVVPAMSGYPVMLICEKNDKAIGFKRAIERTNGSGLFDVNGPNKES